MATLMGFEGLLYQGTKGSSGSNQITTVRDVNYEFSTEKGETSARGSGSAPPMMSQRVTQIVSKVTFTMINKTSDTNLTAMLTAAATGNPVALRMKDYSAGMGFDGDVILEFKRGEPYKGEQTLDFEAVPNNDLREPQPYV